MEKDRLAQEARDLAAGTPRNASKKAKSTKATVTGTTASEAAPNKTKAKKKKKKTGPEYFTAQSPKEAAKEAPGKSVNQ
jgi:phage FluMu gp28-like protein